MVGKLATREKSLEDLELYVDPCNMQSSIVWMMDGARDRREGDGVQGNEALERAERNGDNLIFHCAAHEGVKGVLYASHLS
jgi:hypothetical protein